MIPAFDLTRQNQQLAEALETALKEVISAGQFILGPQVAAFEEELGRFLGCPYVVGVASGSDALYLALRALNIGPGDEVVTTPFTFFATVGSILRTGAKPVFSDINLDTFNMDPAMALAQVTPRTRAMLPVHLFGLMADLDGLREGFSGPLIEDAAQALGAENRGRMAGTVGDLGCFSFFPTKNLGAFGDAGGVSMRVPALAESVRLLRVHGARVKYRHEELGVNSRLDAMQAAVLRVKLPYLEGWIARRQAIARRYTEGLKGLGVDEVAVPAVPAGFVHVFHQYTVRADRRDDLKEHLRRHGVGSTVYYPYPLHLQPACSELGYRPGAFPYSEQASREVLSLPMFPELTDDEIDQVIETVAAFYGHGR